MQLQLARDGIADELELLLHRPAPPDEDALRLASERGHKDCVALLLEATANPNSWHCLHWYEFSVLWLACRQGHTGVVQILLDANADPHSLCPYNPLDSFDSLLIADGHGGQYQTPLWIASWKGHLPVVRLLLQAGADKNQGHYDKATPLYVAVHRGNLELVEALLQSAADVNQPAIFERTPLLEACSCGEVGGVRKEGRSPSLYPK